MANAYVNFFSRLDTGGFGRGAQAFEGRASQAHRAAAAVGGDVASATVISLSEDTQYAEIKPVAGHVFASILPSSAGEGERAATRIRIDEGERIVLSRGLHGAASLYLWAV